MKKQLRLIAFLLGVGAFFLSMSLLLHSDMGTRYRERQFITFNNALYAPDALPDLSTGATGEDPSYWSDHDFSRVRTSVLDIDLEEGEVYGIFSQNMTYAARVWVNGKLLMDQGHVSDTPEDFTPKTASFTVYFTAQAHNRIVVQRCNFNHALWNRFDVYIGSQQVITRAVQTMYLKNAALLLFLLTVGLINLGMFAALPGRRRFQWFALGCFCMLVNFAFTNPKLIMLPFPDLNWRLGHKLESCSLILAALFLLLFFRECFGKAKKWFERLGGALVCLALGYYIFLPSELYTRWAVPVSDAVAVYAIAACGLLMLRALKQRKTLAASQRYYLAGIGIVAFGAVLGALRVGPYMALFQIALILFEIVLTVGLAVKFQHVQQAYEESARRENELRRMNESMEHAHELQRNFLAIINHEMRTPLTVIAGYADKVSMQTREESAVRDLRFIKQEALRLGRIVEQSEDGAVSVLSAARMEPIGLNALLKDAQAFCAPICEKRNNALALQCPEGLTVTGVRDSLLQALYNLVINASRHTQRGRILLRAEKQEQEIILSVRDSGDGMDEETIARAFDWGFTKDGGHGLGLALCREIAETHGGRIWIERNDPEKGVTVFMALPDRE